MASKLSANDLFIVAYSKPAFSGTELLSPSKKPTRHEKILFVEPHIHSGTILVDVFGSSLLIQGFSPKIFSKSSSAGLPVNETSHTELLFLGSYELW